MTSGWLISCHDPDAPQALIIYVPPTTQHRGSRCEIQVGQLSFLDTASLVNVQGIGSLIEPRLERKLGQLSPELMAKVKEDIRFAQEL